MKYVKIFLSMAFFVPVFVLFGFEGWGGRWPGVVVGGIIGAFFGLVFSGQFHGRWLDVFFPPARVKSSTSDTKGTPNPGE